MELLARDGQSDDQDIKEGAERALKAILANRFRLGAECPPT